MVTKQVAPYGEWDSVISLDDATAGSKSLSSPRGDVRTGRVFYLESLPAGASTIVEVIPNETANGSPHQLRHVLPKEHSVSTAVYEYGGGPYDVLPKPSEKHSESRLGQQIIFSNSKAGNSLWLFDVDSGDVKALREGKPWLRYSDFGVNSAGSDWVLAIEEDHSNPAPKDVKNHVVGVNIRTGQITRLVEGADFYTNPRFSCDGKWVAWRQWDHPEMTWTKSEIHWAPVVEGDDERDLVLGDPVKIAGGKPEEPVGEALWGPDGALYFSHEVVGHDWRQLYRAWPGQNGEAKPEKLHLEGLEEVEIGNCSMQLDSRTFGFLSDTAMILSYTKDAVNYFALVDIKTLQVNHLDIPLTSARSDPISPINDKSLLVIGAGADLLQGVYHVSLDADLKATTTLLDSASGRSYPPNTFSKPEAIHLVSKNKPKRPIHGFYWPPYNPKFTAPENTLPPLLINPHGGPTGHSGAGLTIGGTGGGNAAFWTSRGFGYFVINYTGSSGYGHAYRQLLQTNWGILDRDDVAECIDYLCSTGRADRKRVGIHGGSAGGYNVLQSLVWYPDVFAGGVSYCGISDLGSMADGTHKLEYHYLDGLLYAENTSKEDIAKIFRQRSPLFHAERITAPLLLVHGDKDTVVPIAQSFEIEEKIKERGGTVKMLVAPGEGHMFKMKASQIMALENEVDWFMKTLVRK